MKKGTKKGVARETFFQFTLRILPFIPKLEKPG
jgi:hypothetical protein